jgi:hypothetical protein
MVAGLWDTGPDSRIYENEGEPEWQLDFAPGFYLARALRRVRREERDAELCPGVRRARGPRRGDPCRGYQL